MAYCDNVRLTTVSLPGTMVKIPDQVFWGCSSLEDVTLGEGITTIGESAFVYCPNLRKLILPASLDSIGPYAFYGNPQMDTLVFRGSVPPAATAADTILDDYHTHLFVPQGATAAYRQHPYWGLFQSIVESSCTGIEELDASDGISIYAEGGRIVVEGAADETVLIYDVAGRSIRNEALPNGIYLVKVGNRQAKKISIE